jgi:hypothetical protein
MVGHSYKAQTIPPLQSPRNWLERGCGKLGPPHKDRLKARVERDRHRRRQQKHYPLISEVILRAVRSTASETGGAALVEVHPPRANSLRREPKVVLVDCSAPRQEVSWSAHRHGNLPQRQPRVQYLGVSYRAAH